MRRPATQLRSRRAGLTLAELSVSLAVIATLMVAIGSIMVLTGRAVGMTATQAGEAKVDDVVSQIASEARMALTVSGATPTSVTFTVADRDNDGSPEKIQYTWAGPGQPLKRKVNNDPEFSVAAKVANFRLGYVTKTAAPAGPVPQTESTTQDMVYSHEGGSTSSHTMSTNAWAAQSLTPNLGRADATSWRVTEVQIHASRVSGSTTGKFWTVSLCPSDALGKPNLAAAIEQKTLQMSSLSTGAAWSPVISFTNTAQNLSPTQQYWIVVSQTAITTTGSVSYNPSSSVPSDPYAASAIAGVWTTYPGRDMKIRVYGRYKYPAP